MAIIAVENHSVLKRRLNGAFKNEQAIVFTWLQALDSVLLQVSATETSGDSVSQVHLDAQKDKN
jgi:hypothetical protein